MKKTWKLLKTLNILLVVIFIFELFSTGTARNLKTVSAATTLNNPKIVSDSSMEAGQKVTWDCVWFGAYPQNEVTDGTIYTALKNATGWDKNNDIVINGSKYRRLRRKDATCTYSSGVGTYNWDDDETYHYFKYEPIKWRVLNESGNDAFLLADVALDDQKYNAEYTAVTWATSSIRSWLNGYGSSVNQPGTDYSGKNFINTAFTVSQKNAIYTTNVINNNNVSYGTAGGSNTSDKIFLLSESEICNTDTATKYGFVTYDLTDDEAKRSHCSTYAHAMGTDRYINVVDTKYNENIDWWLRSPGSDSSLAISVDYKGGSWGSGGSYVREDTNGVRPAMHLNLASSDTYSYAGTVCSDGTKNEVAAPDLKYENPISSGENTNKGNSSSTENTNKNTDKNTNKNTTTSPSKPKPAASSTKKKPSNPIASLSGVLKSVKSPAKNTLALKWKKLNKVTGYQVQISLKSNLKKGTIQRTFKQKVTTTKVMPLKKKKRYYVRIRPYIKKGSKKYYGKWSKVKSVKIK